MDPPTAALITTTTTDTLSSPLSTPVDDPPPEVTKEEVSDSQDDGDEGEEEGGEEEYDDEENEDEEDEEGNNDEEDEEDEEEDEEDEDDDDENDSALVFGSQGTDGTRTTSTTAPSVVVYPNGKGDQRRKRGGGGGGGRSELIYLPETLQLPPPSPTLNVLNTFAGEGGSGPPRQLPSTMGEGGGYGQPYYAHPYHHHHNNNTQQAMSSSAHNASSHSSSHSGLPGYVMPFDPTMTTTMTMPPGAPYSSFSSSCAGVGYYPAYPHHPHMMMMIPPPGAFPPGTLPPPPLFQHGAANGGAGGGGGGGARNGIIVPTTEEAEPEATGVDLSSSTPSSSSPEGKVHLAMDDCKEQHQALLDCVNLYSKKMRGLEVATGEALSALAASTLSSSAAVRAPSEASQTSTGETLRLREELSAVMGELVECKRRADDTERRVTEELGARLAERERHWTILVDKATREMQTIERRYALQLEEERAQGRREVEDIERLYQQERVRLQLEESQHRREDEAELLRRLDESERRMQELACGVEEAREQVQAARLDAAAAAAREAAAVKARDEAEAAVCERMKEEMRRLQVRASDLKAKVDGKDARIDELEESLRLHKLEVHNANLLRTSYAVEVEVKDKELLGAAKRITDLEASAGKAIQRAVEAERRAAAEHAKSDALLARAAELEARVAELEAHAAEHAAELERLGEAARVGRDAVLQRAGVLDEFNQLSDRLSAASKKAAESAMRALVAEQTTEDVRRELGEAKEALKTIVEQLVEAREALKVMVESRGAAAASESGEALLGAGTVVETLRRLVGGKGGEGRPNGGGGLVTVCSFGSAGAVEAVVDALTSAAAAGGNGGGGGLLGGSCCGGAGGEEEEGAMTTMTTDGAAAHAAGVGGGAGKKKKGGKKGSAAATTEASLAERVEGLQLQLDGMQRVNRELEEKNLNLLKDANRLAMLLDKYVRFEGKSDAMETLEARNQALNICIGNSLTIIMRVAEFISELPSPCGDEVRRLLEEGGLALPADLNDLSFAVYKSDRVRVMNFDQFVFPLVMTAEEADVYEALVEKVKTKVGATFTGAFGLLAALDAIKFSLVCAEEPEPAVDGTVTRDDMLRSVDRALQLGRVQGARFGGTRRNNNNKAASGAASGGGGGGGSGLGAAKTGR